MRWNAKSAVEVLADINELLGQFRMDVLPDRMWVPRRAWWGLTNKPLVWRLVSRRKQRRPAFALAWRRIGR